MPSPIIARADALMHRKRQSNGELDDAPVLTDVVDEDDGIPLLTLIDTETDTPEAGLSIPLTDAAAPPASQSLEMPPPPTDPAWRDQLVRELAGRIEVRLKAALPQIIESTVKDFLAEQDMIANN